MLHTEQLKGKLAPNHEEFSRPIQKGLGDSQDIEKATREKDNIGNGTMEHWHAHTDEHTLVKKMGATQSKDISCQRYLLENRKKESVC